MDRGAVQYQRRGHVAAISLSRPATGNAIDDFLALELRDACQQAVEDDEARVIVIEGEGPVFCRGAAPLDAADAQSLCQALARRRVADQVAAIPQPVVVAVQGEAIGQGLELALACDIRVAAQGARLALDQVASGLLPWDGGTQRLPRLIPRGIALDMVLTGRALDAGEALALGLVSQVAPVETLSQKAWELAERLASLAPIACRYAKEAVVKGLDGPLDQGIRLEADLAVLLHTTADRAEGIRAFLGKRQPQFTGR